MVPRQRDVQERYARRYRSLERCVKHDVLLHRGDLCMPCLLEQEPTSSINETLDDGWFDSIVEEQYAVFGCCNS